MESVRHINEGYSTNRETTRDQNAMPKASVRCSECYKGLPLDTEWKVFAGMAGFACSKINLILWTLLARDSNGDTLLCQYATKE